MTLTYNPPVTRHAIRRYAERVLRRRESLAAGDDGDAIDLLQAAGVDLIWIQSRLVEIAAMARPGCSAVIADGGRCVMKGGQIVTVSEIRRHRPENRRYFTERPIGYQTLRNYRRAA